MRTMLSMVFLVVTTGCFSSDPSGDVVPARDRWALSRDGSQKATKSEWAGALDWQMVYDRSGNTYRVAVLTNVSGPNPSDDVSSSGAVAMRRPMPPLFYLAGDYRQLITAHDSRLTELPSRAGTPLRVRGVMYSLIRGANVITVNGKGEPAYANNPMSVDLDHSRLDRARAMARLHGEIWPIILVEDISYVSNHK